MAATGFSSHVGQEDHRLRAWLSAVMAVASIQKCKVAAIAAALEGGLQLDGCIAG